jgi:hypothetical protein
MEIKKEKGLEYIAFAFLRMCCTALSKIEERLDHSFSKVMAFLAVLDVQVEENHE